MRITALVFGAVIAALTLIPAAAQADPADRFAVGSPALEAAQEIARDHWNADPCGGDVEVTWTGLPERYNGVSSWANPVGSYASPERNTRCRIELNSRMTFGWAKLCTVVVHEYGHLLGEDHDAQDGRLMSAIYDGPLPACAELTATRRAKASLRRGSARRGA